MAKVGRGEQAVNPKPVILHRGAIELEDLSPARTSRGRVQLVWQPDPRIEFELVGPQGFMDELDEDAWTRDGVGLLMPMGSVRGDPYMWDYFENSERISGTIRPVTVGDPTGTVWVEFRVLNLSIANAPGVLLLEADGWALSLDDQGADPMDSPRDPRAYVVTHKGRLYRSDNRTFTADEAMEVLEAFGYYASLCRGAWTGYMLPVGRANHARTRWRRLEVGRIDESGLGLNWGTQRNEGPGIFVAMWPGFLSRWRQEGSSGTLATMIELSIEAGAHTGGEAALLISEVALELLSWAIVVNDRAMVSAEGHDRLGASDRMRMMLTMAGCDRAIPVEAKRLKDVAKRLKWVDGPHAITEVRHLIAHPNKRQKTPGIDAGAIEEAEGLAGGYFAATMHWLLTGAPLPEESTSVPDYEEFRSAREASIKVDRESGQPLTGRIIRRV